MKKIGKITINPEKVIKNEELVNFRGGWYPGEPCPSGEDEYVCACSDHSAVWSGCYENQADYFNDLLQYCDGSGRCDPAQGE
ncbi:MAG: hypothetical protein PHD33_06255 [Atribacterota bacterium]|jgi:hypothetical protein|nr:hypothetical protein [Atribacterota bacterium]